MLGLQTWTTDQATVAVKSETISKLEEHRMNKRWTDESIGNKLKEGSSVSTRRWCGGG
jgi:hypothetical protein